MIKFQTVAIIFILLVVPISLLLTYYINSQIDTIAIQNSYDTKLLNATYDAIVAFQLNTKNNRGYSSNADPLRRDITASINTFTTSLANNFDVTGSGKNFLAYIPAVVYTLYDGYYIYSPIVNTTIDEDDKVKETYENTLKPYVYYTARYYKKSEDTDFVVNYSLDNYIVIYGKIKGTYHSEAGYLINYKKYEENNITVSNGVSSDYFNDAKAFTEKVSKNGDLDLSNITVQDMVIGINDDKIKTVSDLTDSNEDKSSAYYEFKGNADKIFVINDENDPDDKTSAFCEHKNKVIKKSIQANLTDSINNYTARSEGLGTTYDFKIPIISDTEWDKILSNVSIITFMQGLQIGLKTYNNYMIVSSTDNMQYVDPEALYFVTSNSQTDSVVETDSDGNEYTVRHPVETASTYYHKINCPLLAKELEKNQYIEGYKSIDFEGVYGTLKNSDGTDKLDQNGEKVKGYTYEHQAIACYECIVSSKAGGLTTDIKDKDLDSSGRRYNRKYAFGNTNDTNSNLLTFITKYNDEKDYESYYKNGIAEKLRNAYYSSLFKERRYQTKVSAYVNGIN